MRRNSVVIDNTHGLILFTHMTKSASNKTSAKPQSVFTGNTLTIPPMKMKTITAFVDYPSEWNRSVTITLLAKFTVAASLLIFHPMSTILAWKVAVRVTNTTESTYLNKRNSNWRVLRSHSGAIQTHQTYGHGIPQYDSGR